MLRGDHVVKDMSSTFLYGKLTKNSVTYIFHHVGT
jgi:hypothetical protein